ncbi:hypothetical protein M231_04927 [Tremella mesenterica]|uniref:Rieske domain-containing protein n=1 Tax=Tremella mesenterica TaxID=5217 RepID=A0A4Q1BJ87_TREME|nr:hypothetical protein M231_04927 [Tremella mesenterica]
MTGTFIKICTLGSTLTHTRFHLSLRTVLPPVIYHRLLLFRIIKPTGLAGSDREGGWSAPELYCMEETCPHLGAPLSHAEVQDMEDSMAIVCPWHQYDFDLRDGSSSTGLKACTYEVQVRGQGDDAEVWIQTPHLDETVTFTEVSTSSVQWELVEMRGVSEEFADPPPPPTLSKLSLEDPPTLSSSQSDDSLPLDLPDTLLGFAHLILRTSHPQLKCTLTREAVSRLRAGKLHSIRPCVAEINRERSSNGGLLDVPPRQVKLVDPGAAPKRGKGGSEKSRILMLHALANIEQYAIDLAWDIIARFADFCVGGERLPVEYFLDWAKVAEDEAKHFTLLSKRLVELGSYFGAHSVHAALWDSAVQTSQSLSARIAIIHLVAEARGIDTNPMTMAKLQSAGDKESTRVLEIIHADEITHVTTGHRWFTWLCQRRGVDPITTFRQEVSDNFRGKIRGPFNVSDRLTAGLTPAFYEDLRGKLGQDRGQTEGEGDEYVHPRLK